MKFRLAAAVLAGVAATAAAPGALANHDSGDPGVCDTSDDRGGHHGAAGPADVVVPLPAGYEVWAPGGHYVLRGPDGYVEVVGGQGYNVGGNQGGYIQGSVSPAGVASANFHVNAFAGQTPPYTSQFGCVDVSVAGQRQRVATPGSQP